MSQLIESLRRLFGRPSQPPQIAVRADDGRNGARSALSTGDFNPVVAAVRAQLSKRAHSRALRVANSSLVFDHDAPELLCVKAEVLIAWGRYREALQTYLTVAEGAQRDSVFCLQVGWCWMRQRNISDATLWMRKAVLADTNAPDAHLGLAVTLQAVGDLKGAASSYERCIALRPNHADSLTSFASCRLGQGDPVAAEKLLRQAVALDERSTSAWVTLAVALTRVGLTSDALAAFARAEAIEDSGGEIVDAFVKVAEHLMDDGATQDAIAKFESKLPVWPAPEGHGLYAIALLRSGQLSNGWDQYEFRWTTEPLFSLRPGFAQPPWSGQDLHGRTILLCAEQGFGDAIQFIRYAPLLKAMGATVLLRPRAGMESLSSGFDGIDRLVSCTEPPLSFDYYANLMSLPRAFGTEIESIPAKVPYLRLRDEQIARWASNLKPTDAFRIGLVWAGNPAHPKDAERSIALTAFLPLLEMPGVRYYSLQKGSALTQIQSIPPKLALENLDAELADFSDTAAAISRLDLVICVDTAVAHLAGALGKPVWVLLSKIADWRWMEERGDSPWYPTMRLFRQSQQNEWGDVIAQVVTALTEKLATPAHSATISSSFTALPTAKSAHSEIRGSSRLSSVAEARVGIMQYFPDQLDLGESVRFYGEYLQPHLDLLERLVSPQATVVEVNAGVGFHSLGLARFLGREGHLMLYENDPVQRRILRQNLANGVASNTTVLKRTIGSLKETDIVGCSGLSDPVAAIVAVQEAVGHETLDELQLVSLELLKINAAAVASDVLAGATDTLQKLRPKLFITVPDEGAIPTLTMLAKSCKYRVWRIETPLFNPQNFYRRHEDIFAGKKAFALLALPDEIPVPMAVDRLVEIR